jgi:hypothetical protein
MPRRTNEEIRERNRLRRRERNEYNKRLRVAREQLMLKAITKGLRVARERILEERRNRVPLNWCEEKRILFAERWAEYCAAHPELKQNQKVLH